jgi:hypothetical protein
LVEFDVVPQAWDELLANGRPLCREHGESASILGLLGLVELAKVGT